MKRFISISVTIMVIVQSIVLYLFTSDTLPIFKSNLVDIIWTGSALFCILFGFLFFRINKEIKKPTNTIVVVLLFGIIGFYLMLLNHWLVVLFLIILTFALHFYIYRDNKFTIIPVIAFIMGIYSIGLYLLMRGITSM